MAVLRYYNTVSGQWEPTSLGAAGAIGATGPSGPQGLQGPAGPSGPQGPAGLIDSSTTQAGGGTSVDNIVVISQADYTAIGTKDANTLYFIT